MHPDLIQRHADQHLATLRQPRVVTEPDGAVSRFRHALARALRMRALRLESPLAAGASPTS